MILSGKLFAESPIYRGNARKTLFTRDGNGVQRLVSLAGEVSGTAQFLMDAFVGGNERNMGLLPRMWKRLYGSTMPDELITRVRCQLQEESYPRERFFDLRMGIRLDEDRWAAEANANYKIETLFRNSVFDIEISIKDSLLDRNNNSSRLYYVLQELKEGRFWFGAGKSKGLGRCRLEMDTDALATEDLPDVATSANHLTISLTLKATNPILVGWNWGKLDPAVPAFAAIEGRLILGGMQDIIEPIRDRLQMVIGGPILSSEDWKKRLAEYLPRTIAIWLMDRSRGQSESYVIPNSLVSKLGKGKYPLSPKLMDRVYAIADQPFPSREMAESAINEALGKKSNMANRVLELIEHKSQASQQFNSEAWTSVAEKLGLDMKLSEKLAEQIRNENELVSVLTTACKNVMPKLYQQADRQIRLIGSDAWIDDEISTREDHIRIKNMILDGNIDQRQWEIAAPPKDIKPAVWQEFISSHRQVEFRHLTANPRNLQKSVTNDLNHIAFLRHYRNQVRQELSQSYNTDFRDGGVFNRERSRKYGKPFDTVFMRMLSYAPSSQEESSWEIYIPGSTIKGAFRKRASQVMRTISGESSETEKLLNRLFGSQNNKGMAYFSDAYLMDPYDPRKSWCSMDGVKMDPATGAPIEEAKADYLFAYGNDLKFGLRIDVQDIEKNDEKLLSLLINLVHDFQRGDIPIGGQKTNGFGWVESTIDRVEWLTTNPDDIGKDVFENLSLDKDGIWHRMELDAESAESLLKPSHIFKGAMNPQAPPKAGAGFVSHRSFGGYCGTLMAEGEILTPANISESGEPSFSIDMDGVPVNGWDFYSISPPENALRDKRLYAVPSKSIRGMLRSIYTIASNSAAPSPDISHLNPSDSLFGWVGDGQNQAIMGRLSFGFGIFDKPELAWFKIPYPYGNWNYSDGQWKEIPDGSTYKLMIANRWRLFPHTRLAPIVEKLDDFKPDTQQARYIRAILPGSHFRFSIRFWNLNKQEMQRLIWCLILGKELAHKIGNNRYLGFGSLRIQLLPESFLINWANKFSEDTSKWQMPLIVDEWVNTSIVSHYDSLRKALDAKQL